MSLIYILSWNIYLSILIYIDEWFGGFINWIRIKEYLRLNMDFELYFY